MGEDLKIKIKISRRGAKRSVSWIFNGEERDLAGLILPDFSKSGRFEYHSEFIGCEYSKPVFTAISWKQVFFMLGRRVQERYGVRAEISFAEGDDE